jgi:hypothetical protein
MASHKYSKSMAEDLRTVGNYSFHWTKEHTTKEKTDPLRFEHDELGAATVNIIQKIHQRKQEAQKQRGEQIERLDMFATLKANRHHNETLEEFWTQVNTVPDWVNWEQLERGQRFFATHWEASLASRSRDLLARTRLQQV